MSRLRGEALGGLLHQAQIGIVGDLYRRLQKAELFRHVDIRL